jgi:hypothetical protein
MHRPFFGFGWWFPSGEGANVEKRDPINGNHIFTRFGNKEIEDPFWISISQASGGIITASMT